MGCGGFIQSSPTNTVMIPVRNENQMGVEYTVACRACKVKRDLHKIKLRSVKDQDDAVKYSEELEGKSDLYREGLLLSFMDKHSQCDSILYFSEFDDKKECEDFSEEQYWN